MSKVLDLYTEYIWQNPSDYYHDFAQATYDELWEDTRKIYSVKEEAYPFDNTYTEYEAHVNSVSEFIVNTTKVSGDYIRVMFKDIDHAYNHRGQKYKLVLDDVNENTYLCYEKLNPLNITPDFKCIKCNNLLTFLNSNGQIIKEPCSIGYELTSTNSNITKDATIEQRRLVCLVQYNENTKEFATNQRFLLTKEKSFKITQFNDMNKENTYDENPTMMTMYIEWGQPTANDNKDLLIADYYNYDYVLNINSADLSLVNGDIGTLTATVTLNDEVQDVPITWISNDLSVVSIDSQGSYTIKGSTSDTAILTCQIADNSTVVDSINVTVVASTEDSKEIVINPSDTTRLLLGMDLDVAYGVYNNNILTTDVVTITPSGASSDCYTLVAIGGVVTITNIKKSSTNLTLTFSSGILDDKVIDIILGGIM